MVPIEQSRQPHQEQSGLEPKILNFRKKTLQRTSSMPLFAASPSQDDLALFQSDLAAHCEQIVQEAIRMAIESIDLSCMSLIQLPDCIEELKFMSISRMRQPGVDAAVAQSLSPKLQVYLQGNMLTTLNEKLFLISTIHIPHPP
jgi:hypothetical protein